MLNKREKKSIYDNAQLMATWNWKKNEEVGFDPHKLTSNSGKKAWWICPHGHEWQATIDSRSKGHGCPYCCGMYPVKGETDLQTVNPILASEWNYEKNINLTPSDVLPNSSKKAWWICNKGHEWQATIGSRNGGCGCPYCSGRFAISGKNDLQTVNPSLAKEWNYERNGDLTPRAVLPNSNKRVWWICEKGHEWEAQIGWRNKGSDCPVCNSERNTSFQEYVLEYYLNLHGIETVHAYRGNGYELDIYIPSMKIAIEYDGSYWHKDKTKKDLEKNAKCENDGIKLYRIREGLAPLYSTSIDYVVQENQHSLSDAISEILSEITGTKVDVNLKRDAVAIENLREHTEKESSVLFANPQIAAEWNYEKNGRVRPENFLPNSSKRVWWKCSKGHEWQATIINRHRGYGCPYCSGRKAIVGETDLRTINPALASEWNTNRNGNLTPESFSAKSQKKVWWICSKGHEWEAAINSRSSGNGCPYCSSRKVLEGYNDLKTVNPILILEWNYEKNGEFRPEHFAANSNKKVWWKCANGHEWDALISNRNNGARCPFCMGKRIAAGENDLLTINPVLAQEWDYEKNDSLTPAQVSPNSHKKVWWKCNKGHEWQASIYTRNKGHGCPYCSGRLPIKGETDLQTINPQLAKEWHYEKNHGSTPAEFKPNSGEKVWWQCQKGHEWQAAIYNRNRGDGCPYCAGRYKPER